MQKMELLLDQIAPGVDFTDRIGPPVRLPDEKGNEVQPAPAGPHLQTSGLELGTAKGAASPFGSPRSTIRENFAVKEETNSELDSEDEMALVQTRVSRTHLDGSSGGQEISDLPCYGPSIKGSKSVLSMGSALALVQDDEDEESSKGKAVLVDHRTAGSSAESTFEDRQQFIGKASSFHIIPLLSRLQSGGDASTQRELALQAFRPQFWKHPPPLSTPQAHLPSILSTWPEQDLEAQLVESYFRHVHREHPFLNELTFREELQKPELRSDLDWLGVAFGVFCCGARFVDDERCLARVPGSEEEPQCGDIWWNSKTMLGMTINSTGSSLHHLQSMLMFAVFVFGTPLATTPAWACIGVVSRLLIDAGIHRRMTARSLNRSVAVDQAYLRLWWCVYVIDREMSAGLGRPICIQ